MENMKFKISSPEQSEALQKVLFSQGYVWNGFGDGDEVRFTDGAAIFTYGKVLTYSRDKDIDYFENHGNIEVDTAAYIAKHTVAIPEDIPTIGGRVKSDGLSTSYYQLTINTAQGSFQCEMGDVIEAVVGNDFDLGNALKAARRIYEAAQGRGKDGIDLEYDKNKINYFVDMFIQKHERKQSEV